MKQFGWPRLTSGLWVLTLVFETVMCATGDAGGWNSKPEEGVTMFGLMTSLLGNALSDTSSPAARRVLRAEVSPSCSLGLLRFVRALQTSEPWVLRFLDASGKFPNGMQQGTMADLGAFDECVETVIYDQFGREDIRGQYCNVDLQMVNDTSIEDFLRPAAMLSHRRIPIGGRYMNRRPFGMRLGICMTTDCSAKDLQVIADAVTNDGVVKVAIRRCVTNQYPPMDTLQTGIIGFIGTLLCIVALATACDMYFSEKNSKKAPGRRWIDYVASFSIASNTGRLLVVPRSGDPRFYRFLHGLRFFSIFGVVLGHAYMPILPLNSRPVNTYQFGDRWEFCIVTAAYFCVDTLFFISGFLLVYNISKAEKGSVATGLIYIVRRFIRITLPLFFAIMCFYVVPLLVKGPNTQELYEKFYADVRHNWWALLVQGRNAIKAPDNGIFWHVWYLSADFQLFIIALPVVLAFKRKPWTAIAVFTVLSVLGSSVTAWQMYDTNHDPFAFVPSDIFVAKMDMFSNVYVLPSCHAVCFFTGCICQFLVQKYGQVNISKVLQLALWCISLACGSACVFGRYFWNHEESPTKEWVNIVVAFCARPLWSICLAWIAFACATRRGGFLNHCLSWEAFTPFSRLILGVYIIHLPLHYLIYSDSRERMPFFHFTLVTHTFGVIFWSYLLSYVLYLICEAPTRRIGEILLEPQRMLHYTVSSSKTDPCLARCVEDTVTGSTDFSKKTSGNLDSTASKGIDKVYNAEGKYTAF